MEDETKFCPKCGGDMLYLPKGECDKKGELCFAGYVWLCVQCGYSEK